MGQGNVTQNEVKRERRSLLTFARIVEIAAIITLLVAVVQFWVSSVDANRQEAILMALIDNAKAQVAAQQTLIALQQSSGSPQQIQNLVSTNAAYENENNRLLASLTPGLVIQTVTNVPTMTASPTQTDTPAPTGTNTSTPTSTHTPLPSATPTPPITLPFQDNFDTGIRPEWNKLGGNPLIQDGWVGSAQDDLTLEIGDDSLTNFTLDLDYKNLRGTHEVTVTFDEQLRLAIGEDGTVWQAFDGSGWINLSQLGGFGGSGHLTIEVSENIYKVFRNQELRREIAFGDPIGGPIKITVVADRYIDSFLISQP